jgi:hypothetical protein
MAERTIGEVLRELDPPAALEDIVSRIAAWPPDAFAATSAILLDSGAYRLVASPHHGQNWPASQNWNSDVVSLCDEWRAWCENPKGNSPASRIVAVISGSAAATLSDLCEPTFWTLLCAVFELHAVADEACVNLGLTAPEMFPMYAFRANSRLAEAGTLSMFPEHRLRVLPKMRTPQVGISLRSLSLHASFSRCPEVRVAWRLRPISVKRLNVLLFPWPFEVSADAFASAPCPLANMPSTFGIFDYNPSYKKSELLERFDSALTNAMACGLKPDAAVLPECAVTDAEYEELFAICERHDVDLLVGGVRGPQSNEARLCFGKDAAERERLSQHKHHRWCLEQSQINRYGLQDHLDPNRRWWESAALRQREIAFLALNDWLTVCHLVCEDLARIDPVAQVVRAVGPTLVIALLLDGPQRLDRWPARYASILADDPGSSVLTLTSLGMVERSRLPADSRDDGRIVAFWRDPVSGGKEISLDVGSTAVLLTLEPEWVEEFAADGRGDNGCAGRVVLASHQQIR